MLRRALLAAALVLPAQAGAVLAASALVTLQPTRLGLLSVDLHPSVVLPSQLALLALVVGFGGRQASGGGRAGGRVTLLTVAATLALGQLGLFATALLKPELVMSVEALRALAAPVSLQAGLLALLGPVVLAPISEELLYRGLLQRALRARLGPALAIGISAGLFALAHGLGPGLPLRLGMGALWGLVAWRTGSLLPGMIAHGVSNLVLLGWKLWLPFPWLDVMGAPARALGLALCALTLAWSLRALTGGGVGARRYTPGHAVSPALHPRQA